MTPSHLHSCLLVDTTWPASSIYTGTMVASDKSEVTVTDRLTRPCGWHTQCGSPVPPVCWCSWRPPPPPVWSGSQSETTRGLLPRHTAVCQPANTAIHTKNFTYVTLFMDVLVRSFGKTTSGTLVSGVNFLWVAFVLWTKQCVRIHSKPRTISSSPRRGLLPLTPYPPLAPHAFLLWIKSPDPPPSPLPFLLNLKLAQLTSLYITKAIHSAHILPNGFFLSITVCIFPLKGQAYLTVLGNSEGVPVVNVGDSIKVQPTSFHYQRK